MYKLWFTHRENDIMGIAGEVLNWVLRKRRNLPHRQSSKGILNKGSMCAQIQAHETQSYSSSAEGRHG